MDNVIQIKKRARQQEISSQKNEEPSIIHSHLDESPSGEKDFGAKIGKTCLYLLTFLTPLFFLPFTVYPLEANKIILAAGLLIIAAFSYLASSLHRKKIVYPGSLTALSVLLLSISAALSAVFSQATSLGIYGGLNQPESLLAFIIYSLAFFLSASFLEKKDFSKLAIVLLVSLSIAMVLGWLGAWGKLSFLAVIPGGFNTAGAPSALGMLAAMALAVAVLIVDLSLAEKIKTRIALIAVGILALITLIILNNYFLWIALGSIMLIGAAYKFITQFKLTLPLTLAIIALLFILSGQLLQNSIFTPEIKLNAWPALNIVKDFFRHGSIREIILGAGPGLYNYAYALYRPLILNQTDFWFIRFNQGFSFLASLPISLGILGSLAMLLFIFSFIKDGVKSWRDEKSLIVFNAGALLVAGWLLTPASFTQSLFIFMAAGILATQRRPLKEIPLEPITYGKLITVFVLFVALSAALLTGGTMLGKKYLSAVYYGKTQQYISLDKNGGRAIEENNMDKYTDYLNKALAMDSDTDIYLRDGSQLYLLEAGKVLNTPPSKDQDPKSIQAQFNNNISSAVQFAKAATDANPLDYSNWDNIGGIYENLIGVANGADQAAEDSYKKSLALNPKSSQAELNLARVSFFSAVVARKNGAEQKVWADKISQAKNYLNDAFNLKPNYQPVSDLQNQIIGWESSASAPAATSTAVSASSTPPATPAPRR